MSSTPPQDGPDDLGSQAPDAAATPEPATPEPATPDAAPRPRRRTVPSRLGLILVAILAGSGLFVGGFSLGAHVATTPGTPTDEETRFGPFWDVYQLIQNNFAGATKPTKDQLVQGAIKGMMEALNDQWSYYQGPTDFQNSLLNVGGQAEGIGVQVQLQPVDPKSTVEIGRAHV
jgi:hypothetical protein